MRLKLFARPRPIQSFMSDVSNAELNESRALREEMLFWMQAPSASRFLRESANARFAKWASQWTSKWAPEGVSYAHAESDLLEVHVPLTIGSLEDYEAFEAFAERMCIMLPIRRVALVKPLPQDVIDFKVSKTQLELWLTFQKGAPAELGSFIRSGTSVTPTNDKRTGRYSSLWPLMNKIISAL